MMKNVRSIAKPLSGEYPEYAAMYINLLPGDGRVLDHLWSNFIMMKEKIYPLPESKLLFRYDPGKWTIKETLVHIIDDERIYAYRALRFARHDEIALPGFEQDEYAKQSGANERTLDNIFDEYESVRRSTIAMFNGFPEESLARMGTANGNRASVRSMAYHIAGHELHHYNLIRTKYLY
jgi:uncharacterized damage-inducible protein DinB